MASFFRAGGRSNTDAPPKKKASVRGKITASQISGFLGGARTAPAFSNKPNSRFNLSPVPHKVQETVCMSGEARTSVFPLGTLCLALSVPPASPSSERGARAGGAILC
jgi:hypothetical protein